MATRTFEGFELDNGDMIYQADDDGDIEVRDVHGSSLGLYRLDDPEWVELASYFGLTGADFPDCGDCGTRHRRDKHLA